MKILLNIFIALAVSIGLFIIGTVAFSFKDGIAAGGRDPIIDGTYLIVAIATYCLTGFKLLINSSKTVVRVVSVLPLAIIMTLFSAGLVENNALYDAAADILHYPFHSFKALWELIFKEEPSETVFRISSFVPSLLMFIGILNRAKEVND